MGNRKVDILTQRTALGCHRDDLKFSLGDYPARKIGSQGQQKTFILALRLAQFNFLKDSLGLNPILMLDDVFDKLDSKRIRRLLDWFQKDEFGQLILTDARKELVFDLFPDGGDVKFFEIQDGGLLQ